MVDSRPINVGETKPKLGEIEQNRMVEQSSSEFAGTELKPAPAKANVGLPGGRERPATPTMQDVNKKHALLPAARFAATPTRSSNAASAKPPRLVGPEAFWATNAAHYRGPSHRIDNALVQDWRLADRTSPKRSRKR